MFVLLAPEATHDRPRRRRAPASLALLTREWRIAAASVARRDLESWLFVLPGIRAKATDPTAGGGAVDRARKVSCLVLRAAIPCRPSPRTGFGG